MMGDWLGGKTTGVIGDYEQSYSKRKLPASIMRWDRAIDHCNPFRGD